MVASNYMGPSRHISELKCVINVKYTQDVTELVQKQKLECNLSQYLYFDYMFKWYYRVKQYFIKINFACFSFNLDTKAFIYAVHIIFILEH